MGDILKEKEEVQEFLKNLGIEYRFSCYSEKNPEGCQLLGEYLSQIDRDFSKANVVFKNNCDTRNFGRSCSSYALNLLKGQGCLKDISQAVKYFEKSCNLDDATGCDFAGKLYTGVDPTIRNRVEFKPELGLSYLTRGCHLESTKQLFEMSESCYTASFIYAHGLKNSIKSNSEKAIEIGTRACDMGHMQACKLVSILYERSNNEKMHKLFSDRYERIKNQINSNVVLETGRT